MTRLSKHLLESVYHYILIFLPHFLVSFVLDSFICPQLNYLFNEMKNKPLGYQSPPSIPKDPIPSKPKQITRRYESPRRFDSSLGSDTGTSTRESECSEEHSPPGAKSPLAHASSTKLFDSLAAELREKLNGNGPPLLLPPRDYDTVHRSQGNLAAIELRRCRNQMIVGNNIKNSANKQVVSSRGSSGIGSDLAPSPERHDGQSSSDEDWVNDHQESVIIMPATQTRKKEDYTNGKTNKPISTYIYPREPVPPIQQSRYQRSSSRENNSSPKGSLNSHEEEVKPVLTKPVPLENRFREVFKMKEYADDRKKYSSDEDRIVVEERKGRPLPKYLPNEPVESYQKPYIKSGKSSGIRDTDYRANKTDKQKYKELAEHRYRTASPVHHQRDIDYDRKAYRAASPERTKSLKRYESRSKDIEHRRDSYREVRNSVEEEFRYRNRSSEPTRYKDVSPSPPPLIENYQGRNVYKQEEALPYRESMDKMMKSPVMRYKSFEEPRYQREPEFVPITKRHSQNGSRHSRDVSPPDLYRDDSRHHFVQVHAKPHIIDSMTPDSTLQKKSPRDRFQNAKEKFQAMERDRIHTKPEPVKLQRKTVNDMFDRGNRQYQSNGWSSDEEIPRPRNAYKELPQTDRYMGMERDPPGRLLPAKSLGCLVKGYRHSYAEPRNFPRVTGRVGLAAVNPY
uniref:CSON003008 protein n=1 Tax=Culicoides sonorensis TaxID=179676 RepID=A0A336KCJ3_CULSO